MSTQLSVYQRRVAFGDCDSARIYFTPRAVDYALEALELWYVDVLGVSWLDLLLTYHLEVAFVSGGCEFFRALVADQEVDLWVAVTGSGPTTISFSVAGRDASGTACFRATLVAQFRERQRFVPAPIPAVYIERIEAYRLLSAADQGTPDAATRGAKASGLPKSNRSYPFPEGDSGAAPYTGRQRVAYGDCTVAGTVYTSKIVTYAVEAVGQWYRDIMGISWQQQCSSGRGVPFMEIQYESLRPMTPGGTITTVVRVPHLGSSSIGYLVTGYDDSKEPCFQVRMSACYITEETGSYRVTPFPDKMRARILTYQAACNASDPPQD